MFESGADGLLAEFDGGLDPDIICLAPGRKLFIRFERQRHVAAANVHARVEAIEHFRLGQPVAPVVLKRGYEDFLTEIVFWECARNACDLHATPSILSPLTPNAHADTSHCWSGCDAPAERRGRFASRAATKMDAPAGTARNRDPRALRIINDYQETPQFASAQWTRDAFFARGPAQRQTNEANPSCCRVLAQSCKERALRPAAGTDRWA